MKAPVVNESFFPAPSAVAAALCRRVFLNASRQPGAAAQRRGYREKLQHFDVSK